MEGRGLSMADAHGNVIAREGLDRCPICGSKYWENDRCVDCDAYAPDVLNVIEED